MTTKLNVIEIRPYNLKELAAIYKIATRTMSKWLNAHQEVIGEKVGRYYTALQVKIIFERLGLPAQVEEND